MPKICKVAYTKPNENVKENLRMGGGAFLLTLSVVLGVCLVTLPTKTNANAADNTIISSTNTAIQWKVVELSGTDEEICAQINAVPLTERYVRYVLQTDWRSTTTQYFRGGYYVIVDLNGHAITYAGTVATGLTGGRVLEITDSSAGQSGYIDSSNAGTGTINRGSASLMIISGGTLKGLVSMGMIMTGGNALAKSMYDFWYNCQPMFLPSYITLEKNSYDRLQSRTVENTTGASFAIYGSTDDYVSGVYNYEFSTLIENLGPGDCILEKMMNPNFPHYLLYRESPTAPYQVITTL